MEDMYTIVVSKKNVCIISNFQFKFQYLVDYLVTLKCKAPFRSQPEIVHCMHVCKVL